MTRTFRSRALLAAALLSVCTWQLSAAPGFWQAATLADFLKGDVDQLSVDRHGRLTLGPEVRRVFDGAVSVVWAMTTTADGTTYLGTGNDGKVYKVSPDGTGSLFYDSPELEVHALAPGPNGGLYVGTSPDGRIYRVDARGEATPFFDPEDKYIWALATDRKGVVYAATGDKGVVYRIGPDGSGEPYFTSKSTHAISLGVEPSGALLVGTAGPGRVFRVDAAKKGFLLLDTPYQEVRAIRLDATTGMIYVAALNGKSPSGGGSDTTEPPATPTPPPTASVSTEVLSFAVIDVPVSPQGAPATSTASSNPPTSGAVYRILPDGLYDLLWEAKDDSPYDVGLEPDGGVLVATGDKGKIYRLAGEPIVPILVTSVPAQHATTLARLGDRTLLATANPGLLVSMSNTRATRGTYDSDVKDAKVVASWGSISWRAAAPNGTRVEIYTRAGNTRTPDETWSDWSGPYGSADGSPISSPKARYLQWRAVLTGGTATPVLTSISAAYLQRNIRPRVESITVHPAGVAFQKPFSTGETEIAGYDEEPADRKLANQGAGAQTGGPTLGRRIYQRGLQTLAWKAEDDNADDLTYTVLYRREGDTAWRTLKSGLTDTLTVWDTSSTPNGTYVVKVVASDAKAHPAEEALSGELESASFDIDNTAPVVTVGTPGRDGARFVVAIEVRDADSPLTRVEYSLDAQKWQVAYPRDGMLDARRELFEIRVAADAGGRVLVVRATDALNNVGAGQTLIPAK